MTQSFLPKPLLFKEWKEHRWWMVTAFLLLLYNPFFQLFSLMQPSAGVMKERLLWQVLVPAIYHFQYMPSRGQYPSPTSYVINGDPSISVFGAIVAMGLVIALVTVERNRGTLWYTFSFPIRRKDALRVKMTMAMGIVLLSVVLDFGTLLICDLATHQSIPVSVLFRWIGQNLLVDFVLMALGLVCAGIIQFGMAAGITALLLSGLPWAIGLSILRSVPTDSVGVAMGPTPAVLSGSPTGSHTLTFAGHISKLLRRLSPVSYFSGTSGYGGGSTGIDQPFYMHVDAAHTFGVGVTIWFLFWIVVCGLIGVRAYLRAPLENNSAFLQFPRLWPWFLWGLYGVISFVLVNMTTASNTTLSHTPYMVLVYWLVVWIVVGLAGTVLLGMRRRNTSHPR